MGLILDSSMLIAAERRGDTPEQLVQQVIRFDWQSGSAPFRLSGFTRTGAWHRPADRRLSRVSNL